MYRLIKILIFVCVIIFSPYRAYADVKEDYETAKMDYISSLVSMATYSDRVGIIAREGLADAGWFMKPYNESLHGIDAKFFVVANNEFEPDKEIYILAVTGTESIEDVKIDLGFSKVLFAGNTPAEFVKNAEVKNLTSKDPMIHRGFNKYANAAFFTDEDLNGQTYGEELADFLKEKPNRKLYMVGHSLGGAVVTVGAARLISLGVNPEQLEVVTFGAPAIGNSAFAKQYGKMIPLKRIVMKGDPVKGVLQSIAGGYAQFGKQVVWQERINIYKLRHPIGVYVDAAIRNFYDAREKMIEAGYQVQGNEKVKYADVMVYVSPIDLKLDEPINQDQYYMKEIAYDFYRNSFNGFVIDKEQKGSVEEELAKAKVLGCKWLIQGDLTVEKVQKMYYSYYVSYQEAIYEVATGELRGTLVFTNGTNDFTALQSMMHNLPEAREQRAQIMNKK